MGDLWNGLSLEDECLFTPKEYLEKQSKGLLTKTKNLLYLEIKQYEPMEYSKTTYITPREIMSNTSSEKTLYKKQILHFKVGLKSKTIDYEYEILTFNHDIACFPVEISLNPDIVINSALDLKRIRSFSQFENIMQVVFSNAKIINVIQSMYSMSRIR